MFEDISPSFEFLANERLQTNNEQKSAREFLCATFLCGQRNVALKVDIEMSKRINL